MGKGIIKSGGDDGFYEVELTFERESLDKIISSIDAHIESLTSVIDTIGEGTEKELLKLERNSYIKKKEYLQNNMPEDPTVSAWCADLTEDITGNVGTIEVPGERGIVQIQPGYENNSTYDATRDGQLQPSIASTPAATFYNLAMLPGWQKWKPTYRYGVISNIDTDANTCDVKLDSAESSQQNLDINQELNLTGIDVSYMSCDSSAFEDGDNVLVKFEGQTWDGAQVVGFKDNPKACVIQIKLTRGDETLITEVSGLLSYFDVHDKDWNWYETTTPTYTPKLNIYGEDIDGYWSFELKSPDPDNVDGYWLSYTCEDGIPTQYPYKYKFDDKSKEEDLLLLSGYHEDIIPYWNIGNYYILPTPGEKIGGNCNLTPEVWLQYGAELGFVDSVSRNRIIKSSVPYKVRAAFTSSMFWCGWGDDCITADCVYDPNPISIAVVASSEAVNGTIACSEGSMQTISGDSGWQGFLISGKQESLTITFNGDASWSWNEIPYSYRRSVVRDISKFDLTFLYE